MSQQVEIPYLYLFIHSVLAERFKYTCVHTNYVIEMLNRRLPRFPWCKHNKQLFYAVLREMVKYGLVTKENHTFVCIQPCSQTKRLNQFNSTQLW